jgi:hypothetical protein
MQLPIGSLGFKIKEVTPIPDGEVAGSVSHKRSLRLYRLEWEIPTGKQLGRYHDLTVTTLAGEEAQRRLAREASEGIGALAIIGS